jgi:starvation-inducible DNA-binding protein
MHPTSSRLPLKSRARIAASLNACLADGVDLSTQTKVAHWNVKGPLFTTIHPFFDTIATSMSAANDEIAERAVQLGALTEATARRAGASSRIREYPSSATDGLKHCQLLVDRLTAYLDGLRDAQSVADELEDPETVDLLTTQIEVFEKHAWFLHATLER